MARPNGGGPISEATAASAAPQRIEMWWLPNADRSAPTVLYLHGTFRTLVANVRKIEALRTAGFSVLAVEYRGWGLSTPITPSEQTILQDADVAWAEFQRREPRADRRVIFGHSMGSGVAVDLASRQRPQSDYAGLILESAFTSFPDIALEVSSVAWLLSKTSDERFASIDKIKRVEQPLLMIHGNLDKTVPMVLGEKLFAAANPPKQWVMIEGGKHSDLDEAGRAQYQQAVQQFRTQLLQRAAAPAAANGPVRPFRLENRADAPQQARAGPVQTVRVTAGQARLDVLGQHLAQLHAPLVKTVDAPERTADEHPVLVQRNQRAQAGRRQVVQQQEGAGAVAREVPVATGIRCPASGPAPAPAHWPAAWAGAPAGHGPPCAPR
jgi:alpha-beta hydrolase superfamily lysophospholipase